jgi:hypothetical protein
MDLLIGTSDVLEARIHAIWKKIAFWAHVWERVYLFFRNLRKDTVYQEEDNSFE